MNIQNNIVIYVINFFYNYHIMNKIYKTIVMIVNNQVIYNYQDVNYIKLPIQQI